MKEITIVQYKIKERLPDDGAICWVKPINSYAQQLVFNGYYKCWDDAEGDDNFCNLNDEDVYFEIPQFQI